MQPSAALRILVIAAIYTGIARLGLMLGAVSGFAALVWPPSGIALVAVWRYGYRTWPAIAIGAFVVNVWTGAPIAAAASIAVGNTLEAVLGTWLLQRFGLRAGLRRVRDVLVLGGLVAVLAPIASATIGVTALALAGTVRETFAATWVAWWLGDAMGVLVIAPMLFAAADTIGERPQITRARAIELGLLAIVTAGLAALIFSPWESATLTNVRQTYLVFPALIWAALRFGTPGGAAALCVMSAIAITGTALGGGPFDGELADRLLSLQAFMAIVAITTLVLGGATSERDEAVRKREELLEAVSHELKNPLSSIQLGTELLLVKLPAGDRLRDRALAVQRAADRMGNLIQSMLDLGAIERGALSVQLRSEDAGSIVEEIVETLRPLAAERSHTLAARVPSPSPTVRCDRERVLQILANLVGNAIKYAPDPATIEVTAVVEQGCVRFSVHDTGAGIAPDQLEHVFERYWQARPNGRKGSGLGLYICRGLVHAHQGQIWVDSVLGKGTTFHFTLRTPP